MKSLRAQKAAETRKRNAEWEIKISAEKLKIQAIVNGGKCPDCGRGLVRNLALTGWYQCEQFGSEQFRKYPNEKPCAWQGFV